MATVASTISDKLKTASTDAATYCKEIASTIDTKMKAASSSISTESGGWSSTVKTAVANVKNIFSGSFSWGVPELPALKPTWASDVREAINAVKNQFGGNFSWNVPTLKIPVKRPVFSVSGKWEFDTKGNVTKAPTINVEWYRRAAEMGALFNSPTIVGVGDASQPEMLIGEDTLYNSIRRAVTESGGGLTQTVNITAPQDFDAAEAARIVRNNTRQLLARMRGGV